MAATMTKSVLSLAKTALKIAKKRLPRYSHRNSPHKFTQPQLFTILCIRRFLKLDLRSTVQLLADWSDLRNVLGIKHIPHYSTLSYAAARFKKKATSNASSTRQFVSYAVWA